MIDKNLLGQATLGTDANIADAISSLELTALQIVLIVDKSSILQGIITDGDIRRGFMKGHSLEDSVKHIMTTSPLVVNSSSQRQKAVKIMMEHKIQHMPVIDSNGSLMDIILLNETHKKYKHENTILIMAGGLGKRLMPHTKDCPKPMIPINGKPMLEHIIVRAIAQGFSNFIISVFYLPDVIKDYFKNGEAWGVNISYLQEESPLGTAGALSLITENHIHPIIVTNGDLLTDIGYKEILDHHSKHASKATMAVRDHEIQNPFGVVNTENFNITGFEEKPIYRSLINAGIYVLDPIALEFLNDGKPCDMPTLFQRLLDAGHHTTVFPMHESWIDIGHPDDLKLAATVFNKSEL